MKKILSIFACIAMLSAFSATASARDKGGFSGPGLEPTTAKEAATLKDDTPVVMRGNIVQHLGGDKYLFKDASGTIRVEIDEDKWGGRTVSPETPVELRGEVDTGRRGVTIDVDAVIVRQ